LGGGPMPHWGQQGSRIDNDDDDDDDAVLGRATGSQHMESSVSPLGWDSRQSWVTHLY